MSTSQICHSVRLGSHDGKPVFEQVKGLHDDAAGLTVVGGFNSGDPEVMFEEYGLGKGCEYRAPS